MEFCRIVDMQFISILSEYFVSRVTETPEADNQIWQICAWCFQELGLCSWKYRIFLPAEVSYMCLKFTKFVCRPGQPEPRWGRLRHSQDWGGVHPLPIPYPLDACGSSRFLDLSRPTPWAIKKRATFFLIITLVFLGRFLYFLHQWKEG